MKNNISKHHSVFAAFCDFSFLAFISMSLLAVFSLAVNANLYNALSATIIFLVLLLLVATYHTSLKSKTTSLSYGEKIAGTVLKAGEKEWQNPYSKNRWFMFLMIVLTLLVLGNSWDALENGLIPIGVIAGKLVKFGLIFWGIVLWGQGKLKGALIPFFVFFATFLFALLIFSATQNPLLTPVITLNGLLALGFLIVYRAYRK